MFGRGAERTAHRWIDSRARAGYGDGNETGEGPPRSPFIDDPNNPSKAASAGKSWDVCVDPILEGAEQVPATLGQIDFVHRLVEAHPHALRLARTAEGRIFSLMDVEGGAQIDWSAAVLRVHTRAGVRYMTLTWRRTTVWADSATGPQSDGP